MARSASSPPPSIPEVVLDSLGIAELPLGDNDPAVFGRALGKALLATVRHPLRVAEASAKGAVGLSAVSAATLARAVGRPGPAPVAPPAKDRRFDDPGYSDNAYFFFLQQAYLLYGRILHELVSDADLAPDEQRKAEFALQFVLDAVSPTNSLVGNPKALRTAAETRGKSVARGLRNLVHDVRHNGGWPAQVDASGFDVGVNMAVTPGQVVYRSRLIELIQYAPQTPRVYETPLLFCPPWINKYYIMDLAPGKSLIDWAVKRGHTCFAISYRNPDASMRDVGFEDYLFEGPLDAVRVVREITGARRVNTLSVCLGGTLTAIALAYHARIGDDSIKTATFLNTHTDFSQPGALGVFTDASAVDALERRMAKRGYLEAKEMARTFDLLRANDLVFQYVVNNWLLGRKPPAFDLLAWNDDSTRMPAKMHTEYLRSCYVRNDFASGRFEVRGQVVRPRDIGIDTFVLAAIDDHIVPWVSGYKTAHLLGGDSTFVLSSAGHIAGIVNPPSPKAKHWTNDALHRDPKDWFETAVEHDDTWWTAWTRWIARRAGRKVPARTELGSTEHRPLCPAPGTYVRMG